MASFEDFPSIFCLTADFLPRGGLNPCKIITSELVGGFQLVTSQFAVVFDSPSNDDMKPAITVQIS